jgi:hypothetical protein
MAVMMCSFISAQFKKMVTKVSNRVKKSSSISCRALRVFKLTVSFAKISPRLQRPILYLPFGEGLEKKVHV